MKTVNNRLKAMPVLILALMLVLGACAKALDDENPTPYDLEIFRKILDTSKLQWPDSRTAIPRGEFKGVQTEYFYLSNDGYMTFETRRGGHDDVVRAELRQVPNEWKTSTSSTAKMVGVLKLFLPETIKEFTWMQVHDTMTNRPFINKPLIRLVWRKKRAGKNDHIWAVLRTNGLATGGNPFWYDLGVRPDGFFKAEITTSNNILIVKINNKEEIRHSVEYWQNYSNAFKAGIYLSGSVNDGISANQKFVKVQFKSLSWQDADSGSVDYPSYFPEAISSWRLEPVSKMFAPAYLTSITDKDTKLLVTRLGGEPKEMATNEFNLPIVNGGANEAISEDHGQHFYSRTDPANIDESYALGAAGGNSGGAALWDLSKKQLVAWVPTGTTFACASCVYQRQLLWDKLKPNIYWYTSGNKLMRADINFASFLVKTSVRKIFKEHDIITFGEGEGDFSDDGRRLVLVGSKIGPDETSIEHTIIIFKLGNSASSDEIAKLPADESLDWAGVDPTGNYVVLNNIGVATYVLPFDLSEKARILYRNTKHSDFVVDKHGEPWIVYANYQGVFASCLSRSLLKQVWPITEELPLEVEKGENPNYDDIEESSSASGHISRVSGLKGLVLVSRNIDGGLYFLNIDQSSRLVYAGNTRHGRRIAGAADDEIADLKWGVDYYGEIVGTKAREPRGSASSMGKYVFFVSDYFLYGKNYNPKADPNYEPPTKAFLNVIDIKH